MDAITTVKTMSSFTPAILFRINMWEIEGRTLWIMCMPRSSMHLEPTPPDPLILFVSHVTIPWLTGRACRGQKCLAALNVPCLTPTSCICCVSTWYFLYSTCFWEVALFLRSVAATVIQPLGRCAKLSWCGGIYTHVFTSLLACKQLIVELW